MGWQPFDAAGRPVVVATLPLNPLQTTGRLTLVSGNAIPTTDQLAKGTLYYTSVNNNGTITSDPFQIVINNGSLLRLYTSAEISLSLTLTSGNNYDVFIYDNAGVLTLELSAAWTNNTTRADALTVANGQIVKSGATTRRWIGTIRASATNQTADSQGGTTTQVGGTRFVWNAYNAVPRGLSVIDTTDNWSYTTDTIRQANGASGNKVEYVTGLVSSQIDAFVHGVVFLSSNSARAAKVGVGIDSTTTFSGLVQGGYNIDTVGNVTPAAIYSPVFGHYVGMPGLGYHFVSWNEKGSDNTCVFLGDNGGDGQQTGILATMMA